MPPHCLFRSIYYNYEILMAYSFNLIHVEQILWSTWCFFPSFGKRDVSVILDININSISMTFQRHRFNKKPPGRPFHSCSVSPPARAALVSPTVSRIGLASTGGSLVPSVVCDEHRRLNKTRHIFLREEVETQKKKHEVFDILIRTLEWTNFVVLSKQWS